MPVLHRVDTARLGVACAIGLALGVLAWIVWRQPVRPVSDFDQIWIAARAVLHGADPYAAVRAAELDWPLFYPATAAVIGLPLALLPVELARALWVGIGGGLLAYALTARGWWGLVGLGSGAYLHAFFAAQWSPVLTAALVLPWLAFAWPAKPTIGLACFAARPSWLAVGPCLAMVALSFVLAPGWPAMWMQEIRETPHITPLVLRPLGWTLLLALLRWRHPEARLLVALACLPQTSAAYEWVPLLLIPRTGRGQGVQAFLMLVALAFGVWLAPWELAGDGSGLATVLAMRWPGDLALTYLPALLLVLRRPVSSPSSSSAS